MSNYLDYLKWRGDLSFEVAPFCEIDAMLLSNLVYLNMTGLANADFEFDDIDCTRICRRFVLTREPKGLLEKSLYSLAEAVVEAPRIANIKICGYRDELDFLKEQQFAAATFMVRPDLFFVAFRGTDDSLIGWKENLKLSYNDQVPSQLEAVSYLDSAAASLDGDLLVGGHSKGGNLAVYATAFCLKETYMKIKDVYNFDGPGFNENVLNKEGFHNIFSKVHTFVPQNSLIGVLLKHQEPYTVIRSSKASGISEHLMNTWEVGPHTIEREKKLAVVGKTINTNIMDWIDSMSYEEKQQFIDIIFSLVDEFDTVDDLFSPKNIILIMREYSKLNDTNKEKVSEVLGGLTDTVKGNIKGFFHNIL